MNKIKLFISHSWNYSEGYIKLIQLLKNANYFEFQDYSVPETDPITGASSNLDLRSAIENQMRFVDTVIILAGVYSTYSKWINEEIEIAKKMNKKIVAIEPWGAEKTSKIVKENANFIVKWNTDSIIQAIRA
ncbi:MAG: TIR domain-containing protein [Metamycoplasmataceae bacterium]